VQKSINYLDRAKEKLGIKADNEFAGLIGVTRAAISKWRNGKGVMDDYAAAKIAEILGIQEMEVIAAANVERDNDPNRQEFWEKHYKRLGGYAAGFVLAFVTLIVTLGSPSPAQAAPILDTHSAFADDIHYAK
jgi:transcriptional regulator with XRE-family HTH domain